MAKAYSIVCNMVAEWLRHSTVDPESQVRVPSCHREFFFLSGSLLSSTLQMSRCWLEGVSHLIVSTASFGGDVKPSVPGNWLILAFSC